MKLKLNMYIRLYCLTLNDGNSNSLTVNDGKSNTAVCRSHVSKNFNAYISNWAGIPLYRHDTKPDAATFSKSKKLFAVGSLDLTAVNNAFIVSLINFEYQDILCV